MFLDCGETRSPRGNMGRITCKLIKCILYSVTLYKHFNICIILLAHTSFAIDIKASLKRNISHLWNDKLSCNQQRPQEVVPPITPQLKDGHLPHIKWLVKVIVHLKYI